MNELVEERIKKLKEVCVLAHTGSPYHSPNGDMLAVEMEYGEMLMKAVADNKPKEIVEIGTANGYSTNWLILGTILAGQGEILTFDSIDRNPKFFMDTFVAFKRGDEFLHPECLKLLPRKIDFVFHDAQHRYELIIADLNAVIPLMSKDSQIWVHDVRGSELPTMMKDYFNERGYEFTHYPTGNGMCRATRGNIV